MIVPVRPSIAFHSILQFLSAIILIPTKAEDRSPALTLCVVETPAFSRYSTVSMWLFSQASIRGVRC